MSTTIELARSISAEDAAEIAGWGRDPAGVGFLNLVWRPKEQHVLVRAGGQLVSRAGLLKHPLSLSGRSRTVAGVGGVVTRPDSRRRGYARTALTRAHDTMCGDWSVDFGLLFCLPVLESFYRRLGWWAVDPVILDQPTGAVVAPLLTMVHTCRSLSWPSREVKLASLPW
jgi:aminoglycoside 2'-N-acetyltransferase I